MNDINRDDDDDDDQELEAVFESLATSVKLDRHCYDGIFLIVFMYV